MYLEFEKEKHSKESGELRDDAMWEEAILDDNGDEILEDKDLDANDFLF